MIKHKAFTLIELLIVFAVIGLLAGVILASVKSVRERASIAKTLQYSKSVDNLLAADAVGIWNFDDQTNPTKDTSGWANHGTINGATFTADTPHKAAGAGAGKYALSFDGSNDYVNCGNGSSIQLSTIGSVSMWFKPATAFSGSQPNQQHLMSGGPREFYFSAANSKLFYFLSDDATSIASNSGSWDAVWYYIVITSDGTTLKMYIGGIQQTQTVNIGALNFFGNTSALTIGRNTYTFNGIIDEVRVFSRALTQAEIQKIYTEGLKEHNNFASK